MLEAAADIAGTLILRVHTRIEPKISLGVEAVRGKELAVARILVVDDDEVIRASIARMLTREGHEVAVAEDGKDGCLQCYRTQFDLVICDLFMPDKDGIETIRELRASALKIPIICITGGGSYRDVTGVDSGDFSRMIRMFGATQTIAKPFKAEGLLAAVQACLSTSDEAGH